jgi:1,2-diacylglycerol 3-alpha-glucosyltransferase
LEGRRVAVIAACPFPGNHGTPGSIREIVQAQARQGQDVHVVTYPLHDTLPIEGPMIHRVRALGTTQRIVVGPTWHRPFFDALTVGKLYSVNRQYQIDIIHGYNYEGALIGYIGKKLLRKPLIYSAINTMADELPTYRFIRPQLIARGIARFLDYITPRLADHIIALSDDLKRFLVARGIAPEKITVIPNGIDPAPFAGNDPQHMRRHYALNDRPLIVYTGLLNEFQRIDYLLLAMQQVVQKFPSAVLLCVANLVEEVDLRRHQSMVKTLGLLDNVITTEPQPFERVPDFLAAADIAVLARPDCPGLPTKLLNYMAAKRAIVCPVGTAKWLTHMHDVFAVRDHDVAELARGITTLLQSPQLRAQLGLNAFKTLQDRFALSTIVKQMDAVYETCLSKDSDEE